MQKKPIDLIIFDFDGTLTNSIPPAIDAIQSMIKELGYPYKTKEEINSYVGYGEIYLVENSIDKKDMKTIQQAMDVYFGYYKKDGIKNVTFYPNVINTLQFLKEKKKAIISNKRYELMKIILKDHGIEDLFIEVFGGDNAPCLKPDPCAIIKITNENKIPKERTLFVGDMTIDVETGKNAGVATCAVTYGFDPIEKLKRSNPDYLIDDFSQLIEILS
ncbi:hypothetical protein A3J90_04220 [candidate division WOR-1 bacterium RIFOXYC2_FULL_37_10]|uniref:Phosphoglycolate phosphatase n=1 Tax=candidate division WOR-1 bacterium RIFOXYB2_FULL_37_13 TaxID=1802579 RepID=A0A1F4SRB3_UNCSA|nr:MAG: hypothetical protein A2246_02620 [candidate division WOR-1 bacterium RIFOXYA2_FULL_37_7]OGC22966.1 MAG: hypothetical protein A2310_04075 [candidate division WOR-1 bacterium RIFOXYB2_FULL_37_13]OGC34326.1 MAG: hypothetical protein A3J90_04220 [candidate division WOR-1 bacterium RIFOXYC2_FULL_37_10]